MAAHSGYSSSLISLLSMNNKIKIDTNPSFAISQIERYENDLYNLRGKENIANGMSTIAMSPREQILYFLYLIGSMRHMQYSFNASAQQNSKISRKQYFHPIKPATSLSGSSRTKVQILPQYPSSFKKALEDRMGKEAYEILHLPKSPYSLKKFLGDRVDKGAYKGYSDIYEKYLKDGLKKAFKNLRSVYQGVISNKQPHNQLKKYLTETPTYNSIGVVPNYFSNNKGITLEERLAA